MLEENHLYVCLEKCDFLMDNLPFLGHVVTPNGLMADPDKTKAVEDMQPPTNVKEAMSFCGFINYFHRSLSPDEGVGHSWLLDKTRSAYVSMCFQVLRTIRNALPSLGYTN